MQPKSLLCKGETLCQFWAAEFSGPKLVSDGMDENQTMDCWATLVSSWMGKYYTLKTAKISIISSQMIEKCN